MKKLKLLFLMLVMVMCLAISGCGGGFFAEDAIEIASIDSRVEADGTTILTITYVDDIRDPDVFKLPKGAAGNGIKSITSTKNIAGDTTTVTITYTDDTQLPTTFDLKDGVSVKAVESRKDEETGEISLVVVLSDGTESEPFPLPKGEKGENGEDGEDGNGLVGFDKLDGEDGSVTFTFKFLKTEDVVVTIPAPKQGEEGKGISTIMGTEEEGLYVIKITYTDGTEADPIYFNKPKDPNAWLSGSTTPLDNLGVNGDFYFDTVHKKIYSKYEGEWHEVADLNISTGTCRVTFNLNDTLDGGPLASMPNNSSKFTYFIPKNSYFSSNGGSEIPLPEREGYKFLGWYRVREVTSANYPFTDFTVIIENLELFAKWEIIEYSITYELNGGKFETEVNNVFNINTNTFNLPAPKMDGYEFCGWYTSEDFEGDAVIQILKGTNRNLKLFAKWEEVSE